MPTPLARRFSFILLPLAFMLLLSSCAEPPYKNIDNTQLETLLSQKMALYDIRRPDEWKQTGVVPGSRLLTFVDGRGKLHPEFFSKFLARQKKDEPVILICRTGNRSGHLGKLLMKDHGFTQVYNGQRGITRWIGSGHTVKKL